MAYLFAGIAVLAAVYLYLIWPARADEKAWATFARRNYAHRALFDNTTDRPENSLAAFRAAVEGGFGCELDVQFTSDKKLIVFHDNDYGRACGDDRPVWEVPWAQAKELRLFGSEETVPLFEDVLRTVNGRVPLIVEVKAEAINDNGWYRELCAAVYDVLKDYDGPWCVESFNPVAVRWFKKNAPRAVRGQLVNGRRSSPDLSPLAAFGMEQLLTSAWTRPHFIAYKEQDRNFALRLAQKLGAMTVMWTVKSPARHAQLQQVEDAIIFEGYVPAPTYGDGLK